ncbi:MAG: DUF975 domain-containing protein [Gloeotrichia echinulata GP01]
MSGNFNSPSSIQPLSLGNVVSAGLRLYRSHLKSYFFLALKVALWSLLPFLIFIPGGIVLFSNSRFGNNSPLAWLIIMVIGLGLYFYAFGRSLVNTTTISRLAFGELVNQPETVSHAHKQVLPKLWSLVFTVITLSLGFLIILICFVLFWSLIAFFGGLILNAILNRDSLIMVLIIGLLNLLIFFAACAAFIWLSARLCLAVELLAIEDNLGLDTAISRSWDLSKGYGWRIVLILFVAFLITIPIQIIVQLFIQIFSQPLIQYTILDAINGSTNAVILVSIVYLLILLIGFLTNALILPFWQAIKAVIYYDLRSRREGLGLQLRNREI